MHPVTKVFVFLSIVFVFESPVLKRVVSCNESEVWLQTRSVQ
uniref:Uncharacterized protein n=1 Tax=Anguilla anguilla TaxID=7936 RepID=A0A0E9T4S1_ANGAN